MDKELVAKILLYIGPFGLAGAIIQGEVFAYPLTTSAFILMMVPYIYIQFQKGQADAQPAETSD